MADDVINLVNRFERIILARNKAEAKISSLQESIKSAQIEIEHHAELKAASDRAEAVLVAEIENAGHDISQLFQLADARVKLLLSMSSSVAESVGLSPTSSSGHPTEAKIRRRAGWSDERRAAFAERQRQKQANSGQPGPTLLVGGVVVELPPENVKTASLEQRAPIAPPAQPVVAAESEADPKDNQDLTVVQDIPAEVSQAVAVQEVEKTGPVSEYTSVSSGNVFVGALDGFDDDELAATLNLTDMKAPQPTPSMGP